MRGASVVFLDIGTNNFADQGYDQKAFASDLYSYAEICKQVLEYRELLLVKFYLVMFHLMNKHVVSANEEIALRVASMPNIYFWHHMFFWNPEVPF